MGKVMRCGSMLGIKEEKIEEYKELHRNVWPDVAKKITEVNIRNYSIYLAPIEGKYYLFSYFEYVGDDFDADMKKMADDPMTQKWWEHCTPCQIPFENRPKGTWWCPIEEVFHQD